MDILAERIKEARLARQLSQEDLANKVGYTSRASINKIEKGKVDVPRSKVEAIAQALHVSPAWLLGLSDRRDVMVISDKMTPLLMEAQDATPDQIAQAARFLAYLKEVEKHEAK